MGVHGGYTTLSVLSIYLLTCMYEMFVRCMSAFLLFYCFLGTYYRVYLSRVFFVPDLSIYSTYQPCTVLFTFFFFFHFLY